MKTHFISLSTLLVVANLLVLSGEFNASYNCNDHGDNPGSQDGTVDAVAGAQSSSEAAPPAACSAEQEKEMPCRCCKIACWYTIAAAATHELGHMPGQAGEQEAMTALRLIRSCMIAECSDLCPRKLSRGLFKPL